MKKLTLLIVLALFIQAIVSSQPCLPDGIAFNTQTQIDSFQIIYPNCTEIEGYLSIHGDDITNLNGLSVLTSIGGDLIIGDLYSGGNPSLISLSGMANVTSIGGAIYIYYNDSLTNLSGLANVTSIGGSFKIVGNNSLTSLGLESLTSIAGDLIIGLGFPYPLGGNPSLTSLTGLSSLTSIGGNLQIFNNDTLTSLTGLDNIDAASIWNLRIENNIYLSTCEVQCICDYLSAPGGTIEIQNNAPGCNSQAEVEYACETIGTEDIIHHTEFSIYPNPATNKLYINSKNGSKIETVNIYSQLGQTVLHRNEIRENIDISSLGQGIYIIELTSSELKIRQKLIIEK